MFRLSQTGSRYKDCNFCSSKTQKTNIISLLGKGNAATSCIMQTHVQSTNLHYNTSLIFQSNNPCNSESLKCLHILAQNILKTFLEVVTCKIKH